MTRIEVRGGRDALAAKIITQASTLGISLRRCDVSTVYYLETDPTPYDLTRLCDELLVDPVTQTSVIGPAKGGGLAVEVSVLPGVTDIGAREVEAGMEVLGIAPCAIVIATRYTFGNDADYDSIIRLADAVLANETVEAWVVGATTPSFGIGDETADDGPARVEQVPLSGLSPEQLAQLSRDRLLSLDTTEMAVLQRFYDEAGRDPTDVELETLAQTWSEHCVHKTFRAEIELTHHTADGTQTRTIDGLLNACLRSVTDELWPEWLKSAFVDDAGIIGFDDTHDLAFKVETHNHPSALEPFGGANTGVGGVVRDVIGVSARPIATTDVLCFGPRDLPHDQLPDGVLHPARIADGVVDGIADYGNKLGLPTVNGAVLYDEGYLGNPLVFCGAVGILPIGSHPTEAQVGDLVVALGGRTGRDGVHGATFSSAELAHDTGTTAGSVVQIGDPITEKGLIELLGHARDQQLYTMITDCGAGGFSSSIGEMGEELGVDIDLANAPLKYPGLVPWEIWISEAQERMVIAVPPANLAALEQLGHEWDVEISVLGSFTGEHNLVVRYDGDVVADLPMDFLHNGLPRRHMVAEHFDPPGERLDLNPPPSETLMRLLRHPDVASKEDIIRRYDHEVRGGTIVRPTCGPGHDGPTDAAVMKPLESWRHDAAFALSAGICPRVGAVDPYAMAWAAVDEAFRNLTATGADPSRVAILDNFCWGNPTLPDRLGALTRAAEGCRDAAREYRAPFISGKDSLFNEFEGRPIPGTLLISAISRVPDIAGVVTSDLVGRDNVLFVVSDTRPELGGSLVAAVNGASGGIAPQPVDSPLVRYNALHGLMADGLIASAHDCSEGGLAVALAEMVIAGRRGAMVDVAGSGLTATEALFSESAGRIVIEVEPEHTAAVEAAFDGVPLERIGVVGDASGELVISVIGVEQIRATVSDLRSVWMGQS